MDSEETPSPPDRPLRQQPPSTAPSSEPPTGNGNGNGSLFSPGDSGSGGGASSSRSPPALSGARVGNVGTGRGRGRGRGRGNRGRPRGGGGNVMGGLLGLQGYDFTPHVITVNAGEDIVSTILAFSRQQQRRRVCILSANGSITNVSIRRQDDSGGAIELYEGRFEILSLKRNDDNTLTLTMSGAYNRVYGGEVVGILTAASPTQIVFGSFICS